MKKLFILSLAVVMIITTGTSFAAPNNLTEIGNGVKWQEGIVTATGTGVRPHNIVSDAQGTALARRAAIVDAYRGLAEQIYGVQVDSNTTVEQLMVVEDTTKTSVSGLIKNAKILKEKQLPNGTYQVILSVNLFGAQDSVAASIWTNKPPAIATPAPIQPFETVQLQNRMVPINSVTGVIVDCRGLNLDRVMSPIITDDSGRVIYGAQFIDVSFIINYGGVGYAGPDNPNDVMRAGAQPIHVKALSLNDFNRNPVISREDADKILSANSESGFLRSCPVVFLQ